MTDNSAQYMLRVPTDESGRLEILTLRPPLWEYLLFANRLYVGRKSHDEEWRDYQLGYTMRVGPAVDLEDLPRILEDRSSHAAAAISNISRILARPAQERAFGLRSEPGNVELIEHMARRLTDLYGQLLSWASETRALRVPPETERLKELMVALVSQPIQRTHSFVDEFIERLEQAVSSLAGGDTAPQHIDMTLEYEIDPRTSKEMEKELKQISRLLKKRR